MDISKPEVVITSFDEKEANEVVDKLSEIAAFFGPEQSILVKIDSFGGDMHGMANIYEAIKKLKNPIITYCTSKAMSAGAIILACSGTPGMRFASPMASIMIHEMSAGTFGHIQDMEVDIDMVKAMNAKWMELLAKSMGLNESQDIRDLVARRAAGRELYLTAEQAKECGIIDDIAYVSVSPVVGFNVTVTSASSPKKGKKK